MPNFLQGVLGGQTGAATLEPQRGNGALLHIQLAGVGPLQDDDLVLALSTFPIPKVTNAIIDVPYLNEMRKFAGRPTFDDLSVVYKDYVNKAVADTLLSWRHQVYNPHTGAIGLKSAYAKSGFVQMFAPDGTFERQYNLQGVWPSAYDPGDIDMGGDESLNITLTLTIDKAVPSDGFEASRRATSGAGGNRTTAQGARIGN